MATHPEDSSMPTRPASATTSASGYDLRPLSQQEREQLAAPLSAEERRVILNQGTERPFCGTLLNNKASGLYACRLCGLPLFKANIPRWKLSSAFCVMVAASTEASPGILPCAPECVEDALAACVVMLCCDSCKS